MRNQDRIDPFLKEVRRIWKAHPSLRFGQLLMNTQPVSAYPSILYYIEENELMNCLHCTYGEPLKNVLIMGAAGRDFHNYNVYFKNNPNYKVCCFTATQIPGIDNKIYPTELAGERYPDGIPIFPENKLDDLIADYNIDEVYFCYSDVTYEYIEDIRNTVELFSAKLLTLSPEQTQLKSNKPVISVTAVRTGCGKSSVSKKITKLLMDKGLKVGVIRHPMPYADDLRTQEVQRFATEEDLNVCTIEEREEYEPYVSNEMVVWAGIDYQKILKAAEAESDIILWDGGNNDFSFIKPDLSIVVADPLRVGDELKYYPSDINVKCADVVIVNKCNSASGSEIEQLMENIIGLNKNCEIILTDSIVTVDKYIKGKRVLVVEDGPTLTHGKMKFGAGVVAAKENGCIIISPKPYAVGSLKETYNKYPHVKDVLPAMGYSKEQLQDLENTINKVPCDIVIISTPCRLENIINMEPPIVKVNYYYEDNGELEAIINEFVNDI